jgi:hypothetical protein
MLPTSRTTVRRRLERMASSSALPEVAAAGRFVRRSCGSGGGGSGGARDGGAGGSMAGGAGRASALP